MKIKAPSDKLWILLVVALFALVYQFSGTFAYVEGDDATSIAYHVMGRNDSLQPPYSPYHGMMDKFLSILPTQENVLRVVAMGITRVANMFMVILVLLLTFDLLNAHEKQSPAWYVIVSAGVLLAIPEIFYLGLVYSPSLVAMCFVLLAHLILRKTYRNPNNIPAIYRVPLYLAAAILFGLGVSFRWNVAAYGLVVVADLTMIQTASKSLRNRLVFAAGWGFLALLSSFLMISLSGYGISAFIDKASTVEYVMNQAGTLQTDAETSYKEILMRSALTFSPMFSPVFSLILMVGMIKLVRDRDGRGFLLLAGFMGILPWLRAGVPKFIITILPTLIFVFVYGLNALENHLGSKRSRGLAYAVITLGLLFPWIAGVRVDLGNVAWGPGFELRPYDFTEVETPQFDITFGSGMVFPTPEGPRPLYGHGYVLLGEWKEFINRRAAERQNAIDTALHKDIPLLVTGWSPDYYLDNLYSMGFQTFDAFERKFADDYFQERRFTSSQGETIQVLVHEITGNDLEELIFHLGQYMDSDQIVMIGSPKTFHTLYKEHHNAIQPLGPTSVIVNLRRLISE